MDQTQIENLFKQLEDIEREIHEGLFCIAYELKKILRELEHAPKED